jgi:hypothetical protein
VDVHAPPTCSNDLLSALPQRLACWLLLDHARADGDELVPTQEFLVIMRAVRRSGVIAALASLQSAGVVDQARGHVTICDWPGLDAAACA